VDAEELRAEIGIGRRPAVGMFGFLLPNKGVVETLEAWPAVLARHPRAALLLMTSLFDAPESAETLQRCRETIARLGIGDSVLHITDFLQEEEAAVLLEACDVTVFPYRHSAEGASGAVRLALGAHRPVLCTRQPIFDDLTGAVQLLDGEDPTAIADGISRALLDPDWRRHAVERQDRWVTATSWTTLAQRLDGMLQGLLADRARERASTDATRAAPRAVAPANEEGADVGRTG
jgi:glycosyltransferase involved in cell wall biosynthesis